MDLLQRNAIEVSLVEKSKQKDRPTSESYLQKATYILQELLHVPLEYDDFYLHTDGPYSPSLRDDLAYMVSRKLLRFEFRPGADWPHLEVGENAHRALERVNLQIANYQPRIAWVADNLGTEVVKAERLSSALYVMHSLAAPSTSKSLEFMRRVQPTLRTSEAKDALREAETLARSLASTLVEGSSAANGA